jgi:hypothetical protein
MNKHLELLRDSAGIIFMGQPDMDLQQKNLPTKNYALAMDAQPTLITTSNSGIPAFLSTFVDPKLIEVLVSPMKCAEIVGDETKKGDWTTKTAMFELVESTGEVSTYGDHNENGVANANVNFPQRQSYHYQVITTWGELELDTMGLARIDWANRKNIASALILNKFQNATYFFGVKGLQNYGLLNDPNLLASIIPNVKAYGGLAWTPAATALEVYADIQSLYEQIVLQLEGIIDMDNEVPMTLAMTATSQVALTKTTEFNVNVKDLLAKNFPKMKFETAPEYATSTGNLVQLIVDEVNGQRTAQCAFTEKMRAHPIIVKESSFRQKKSQGTWGTIIYRPVCIASMLGV